MSTYDLTKPVKNNLRGDDTAKFRVANDSIRDALITGDLIKIGHIIYHELDGKHYKLKTYPTFGVLDGVFWEELGSSSINNTLTSDSTIESLSAAQGKVLKGFIDSINALLLSDDVDLDQLQEIVDYIKLNKEELETLSISNIAGLQTALADINDFLGIRENIPDGQDDIVECLQAIYDIFNGVVDVPGALFNKVDKVAGKVLTDNNYDDVDKNSINEYKSRNLIDVPNNLPSTELQNGHIVTYINGEPKVLTLGIDLYIDTDFTINTAVSDFSEEYNVYVDSSSYSMTLAFVPTLVQFVFKNNLKLSKNIDYYINLDNNTVNLYSPVVYGDIIEVYYQHNISI